MITGRLEGPEAREHVHRLKEVNVQHTELSLELQLKLVQRIDRYPPAPIELHFKLPLLTCHHVQGGP
jgi:hypothetical protein